MTTQEFSDTFDVLLNSLAVNAAYGQPSANVTISLNEYEKSVLLTEAQKDILREVYTGSFNFQGFEATEDIRRALEGLVITYYPEKVTGQTGVSNNSTFYQLTDDIWWIVYEQVKSSNSSCANTVISVVPVKQDDWHKIRRNPFKGPNSQRVIRLDCGNNMVELVSTFTISEYLIRYIKKPCPIILVDIADPLLSIDGYTEVTECELNSSLHKIILDRAVQMAKMRMAH